MLTEEEERTRLHLKLKGKREIHRVGKKWVSRWEARRNPYFLKIQDLKKIDEVAILGKRHGTSGIFYPKEDVRILSQEINWIPSSYISEARVLKQMKASTYDLDELRTVAVRGKIKGTRGLPTNYYSEENLFNMLGVSVIPEKWIETRDYASISRYPDGDEMADRRFALHKSGSFRPAGIFYWGREATRLARGTTTLPSDRPSRSIQESSASSADESEQEREGDPGLEERDEDPGLKALKLKAGRQRKELEKTEREIRLWGQRPIYTSTSEESD